MARTWRDYSHDNSDNSDKSLVTPPEPRPIVPTVTIVTGLPDLIRDGLATLANAPAPRLINPDLWPLVVADTLRLASEGWVKQALSLGWSDLDLFGAVPDPSGDPDADGLAVKLCGRRVLALCASFATLRERPNARSYIHRSKNDGARLLWLLARRGSVPMNHLPHEFGAEPPDEDSDASGDDLFPILDVLEDWL